MKKNTFLLVFNLLVFSAFSQFPKLGNDTTLDVATWNLEWFGDATSGNGPSDETTQFNNVKNLLNQTEFDIIGVQEMSNDVAYNNLSTALNSKYETYISDISQTQKMAIYWRKSMFSLIPLLTQSIITNQNYAFASRPPLQVALKTIGGTKTDTLFVIVIHMKAFSDQTSYDRRKNASVYLKSYLEANLVGKKWLVIGDWNDDLNGSTFNSLESPYKNFLDANYIFPSKELTDAGKKSYAFGSVMLDHILQSKTLDSFYFTGSAKVFDNASSFVSNFSNNTSDHFPVYSAYNWTKLTTRIIPTSTNEIKDFGNLVIYPNPSSSRVKVECDSEVFGLKLYDLQMKYLFENKGSEIDLSTLENGIYFLEISGEKGTIIKRIIKSEN
ncbi:MAG: endonuclease/exonuclease/phosphatase family protein [Bacteroidia bacterium]